MQLSSKQFSSICFFELGFKNKYHVKMALEIELLLLKVDILYSKQKNNRVNETHATQISVHCVKKSTRIQFFFQ